MLAATSRPNAHVIPLVLVEACCADAPAHLPCARLKNPHNVCYLNSCAQAFQWIGALLGARELCYGAAEAAMRIVTRAGSPYLPSCLPWIPLISGWRNLARQQDAAEFMHHLLLRSSAVAYHGTWQARLCNPTQVVDTGELSSPLPMDLQGGDVQSIIDGWAHQHAVHALVAHGGVVIIQLKRYHVTDARPIKDPSPITFEPGQRVALPIFDDDEGTSTSHQSFRVVYAVVHHGPSTDTGHYQAVLCLPGSEGTDEGWQFYVCNDRAVPRTVTPADYQSIRCNSYLLGLIRAP